MTKQEYLAKIKKEFPDITFKSAKLLTHGWDDDVVILDNKLVFSFPKGAEDTKLKLLTELCVLPKLEKLTTLPVPGFLYIAKDKTFAGYKYISGEPFTLSRLKVLNIKEKDNIARQIAMFLSELHGMSMAVARKCGVTDNWSEEQAFKWLDENIAEVYKRLPEKDRKYIAGLVGGLRRNAKYKRKVCHCDFTSDHILFDEKPRKISGIIDFGDIQIADPANDFSRMWYYGEDFLDLVIKFYGSKDKNLKQRSLEKYIIHCVNLSSFGISTKRMDLWKKGLENIKKLRKAEG